MLCYAHRLLAWALLWTDVRVVLILTAHPTPERKHTYFPECQTIPSTFYWKKVDVFSNCGTLLWGVYAVARLAPHINMLVVGEHVYHKDVPTQSIRFKSSVYLYPNSLKAILGSKWNVKEICFCCIVQSHLTACNSRLFVLPHPSRQVRNRRLPFSFLNTAIITNMGDAELTASHRRKMNANGMLSLFTCLGCGPSVISQRPLSLYGK